MFKLIEAKDGEEVFVVGVEAGEHATRRLTDMGLIPGEKIKILHKSGGGPINVFIKGSKVALGYNLAEKVLVDYKNGQKRRLTVALAGNPNAGKSTVFNNITGVHQHVSNYPGVTVEKKEGVTNFMGYSLNIVDLPGTYSLSARSEDEVVARNFIIQKKPDIIVHVIDSSNLERNLYLATQLMELEVPLILAMNMSDMAEKNGIVIDYNELSQLLGKPIVPMIGSKNKGTKELLETIVKVAEGIIKTENIKVDYGQEVHEQILFLEEILKKDVELVNKYKVRWLAVKMLENDASVLDIVRQSSIGDEAIVQNEKGRHHLRLHFGDAPEIIVADRRYGFISGACTEAMQPSVELRHDMSDAIDRVMLSNGFGLPIFALVMYIIFKFTFTFSAPVVKWLEYIFDWLAVFASSVIPEGLFQSFVVDGIIGGVGGVLGFFPLVLFMFFAIAFFEDSGYMSRAAFVMDKVMSKFGLHGKSFLPMMISTNGCAVPGLMASRILESKKDRLITMMVTPFMICGAKLPILALFVGAFFSPEHGAGVMFLMYFLSVAIAFGSAWILKKFVFKGEAAHFVMELPPYRLPTFKGLLLKMWERGWLYVKKAGTIILLISIIMWAGFTFPKIDSQKGLSEYDVAKIQLEKSYVGKLGHLVEPIVRPLGMDWRAGVALVAGTAAKEVVVSTLGTIYSLGDVDPEKATSLKEAMQRDPQWNPLKAIAFLIFSLIYLPCLATVAVFYREAGSSIKWTLFLVFGTTGMAWIASFLVYQGGMLLGWGV